MFDEMVGPPNSHHGSREPQVVQLFQNRASEPTSQDMVFQSDDDAHLPSKKIQHLDINRLSEAGVNHCGGESLSLEPAGEFPPHGDHVTQSKNGDLVVPIVL